MKKNYSSKQIKFSHNLNQIINEKFNIILLQSSLHYFVKPYEFLNKILQVNSDFLIIDETPIYNDISEKIKIQVIPEKIYPAKYPLHILNKKKIISNLSINYSLIEDKICYTGIGGYNYQYLVFKKKYV